MAWVWVVRWAGVVVGLCLLAITWSRVVKTLLVPRNMRSLITNAVSQWVILGYRRAARNADVERREQALAAGPPVFLVTLLAVWIGCLYLGYALVMLPLTGTPAAGSPAAARTRIRQTRCP